MKPIDTIQNALEAYVQDCPSEAKSIDKAWSRVTLALHAAPDLLSALSGLLEDHKRMFPEAHPNSTIAWEKCEEVKAARAAIAKAEGK